MAHMAKYNVTALARMLAHYDRSLPANKDIDNNKTNLNYNLAPNRGNLLNFVNQKCCEVKCQKRKDVVKLCDLVVTMPKDLEQEKEDIFFKATYDFLVDRYGVSGDSNIVSAFVHKDESQPHMHFSFVPIAIEKKNKKKLGQLKVCAKEVVTKTDLKMLHIDLRRYLESKLYCKVNILNNATKDGNMTIDELKHCSKKTADILAWLNEQKMRVERTKMGRAGLFGENAIKIPEALFNQLMTLVIDGISESSKLKSLQCKRDTNFNAQAKADTLAAELIAERKNVAAIKQDITRIKSYEYKKGYIAYQQEHARLIANVRLINNAIKYKDLAAEINKIIQAARIRDEQNDKKNTRCMSR